MDAVEQRQSQLVSRGIVRLREGASQVCQDPLTVEEPLEIRIGEQAIAVIMRTPRDDFDLSAGFLLTEGLIGGPGDLATISYCSTATPPNLENIVEVRLAQGVEFDAEQLKRNFYVSSSCGVRGKASIESITRRAPALAVDFQVEPEVLYSLDHKLRAAQTVFAQTGSLHAAALFDECGELLVLREDVGRHNAIDKIAGYMFLNKIPAQGKTFYTTGRLTSEMVIKTVQMSIPILISRSGFTAWGVDLARRAGLTLVGRARGKRFIVLAGEERMVYDANSGGGDGEEKDDTEESGNDSASRRVEAGR